MYKGILGKGDIDLHIEPLEEVALINHVLMCALSMARYNSVMFYLYEGSDCAPTPGQYAMSVETLQRVLENYSIEEPIKALIGETLSFMAFEFDTLNKHGEDEFEDGHTHLKRFFNIDWNPEVEAIIMKWSNRLLGEEVE